MIYPMNGDSFREKHHGRIKELAAYYRRHLLEDIMPFWEERVTDREQGGYFNCFERDGRLYSHIKPGWFVGRNIYTFSALYNTVEKRQKWLDIAEHGRAFLTDKALNASGRLNYMMERDGTAISGETSIFTDHFAVKGFFEYIEASGRKKDLPLAGRLFDLLLKNLSDGRVLANECHDVRFRKHPISFMTLLVAIEGKRFLGDAVIPVIDRELHTTLYTFADDAEKAPLEYVSAEGKPLYESIGRIIDPGHTMESLWFSMREGMERSDRRIVERAGEIVDWVIDRAWDNEYGGFYQNVDVYGTTPEKPFLSSKYAEMDVKWSDKIWWVQAESLYTLALSALLTGNERHFEYFLKLHQFCKDFFADARYGEWYSILHRDGNVKDGRKGFELKGPYHVPRSVMQLAVLFDKYSASERLC